MRKRQQGIVEYVNRKGIAAVVELAKMFAVSPFTIRRDIEYLSETRLVAKIKGGAQRIETPRQIHEAQLPNRMQINSEAKDKIAAKAVEFIQSGDTVFLDGSSTIACLARVMAKNCRNVTVVTNSILVSLELSAANEIHVIGLGGVFDRETFSYVGFDTDAPAESFYVDKAFFSCSGFVPEEGTFEHAAFNRNTKRLIAQQAGKIFILIDSSKFDKRAFARVLECNQIDTLITERVKNESVRERIEAKGIRLVIADGEKEKM
jgi:DeoR/GlpR family transcriptional regulator of sugar metabolism